ncbi:MAG: hypothetical protein HC918_05210 [Oscillatoriales cyanobacterium SM2_1_8]|nr:hypothetical protein [Oscillatoriales cyanobacterium SM2_1_8]
MIGANMAALDDRPTQEILLTVVGDGAGQPAPSVTIVVDGALLAPTPPLAGLQRRGWLAHRWEGGTLEEYLDPTVWAELQSLGATAKAIAAAMAPWQTVSLVAWDGESQFATAGESVTVAGGPYLQKVQTWGQTLAPGAIVVVVLHRAPSDLPLVLSPPPPRFRWGRRPPTWLLLSPDRDLGDRLRAVGWHTFTEGQALQQHLEECLTPTGMPVQIYDARGHEVGRWDGGMPARCRFALPVASPWFELVWRPHRPWGLWLGLPLARSRLAGGSRDGTAAARFPWWCRPPNRLPGPI